MKSHGWVINWRKIEDWEWYTTPHMAHLFQHLIRRANHENRKWQGVNIKRGQLVTSLESLRVQTGISVRSLRTCLVKLLSTGEITQITTSRYRKITICNYKGYQDRLLWSDKPEGKQTTSDRQTTDKRPTTNNNVNNENNVNNGKKRGPDSQSYKKTKLFPIKGKTCSQKGCRMPAVYKTKGEYPEHLCSDHMPDDVKEKFE